MVYTFVLIIFYDVYTLYDEMIYDKYDEVSFVMLLLIMM